ncbi:hypothetical protein OKW34_002773 [Paraburkholderia youngii]|uniref:hypothetical protein n=1 Tax=Paraburkholderia youngii TaxID=2782701 RepID=UPI003D23F0A5
MIVFLPRRRLVERRRPSGISFASKKLAKNHSSPERLLKTFVDGRNRIVAVAERKMWVQPGQLVRLASFVFSAKALG